MSPASQIKHSNFHREFTVLASEMIAVIYPRSLEWLLLADNQSLTQYCSLLSGHCSMLQVLQTAGITRANAANEQTREQSGTELCDSETRLINGSGHSGIKSKIIPLRAAKRFWIYLKRREWLFVNFLTWTFFHPELDLTVGPDWVHWVQVSVSK